MKRSIFFVLIALCLLIATPLFAGTQSCCQLFPATGQTSCWPIGGGDPIDCLGTGQDGDIQAGVTLSYTDNGNGTITDNNTHLMWRRRAMMAVSTTRTLNTCGTTPSRCTLRG